MTKAKSTSRTPLVCVITGKDTALVNLECDHLLDELIEKDDRQTALLNLAADEASIGNVLDELRTLPFFSPRRFVLIKDADDFISANRPLLEKYFDSPCPTGTFLLTVSSWQSNTRLAKKLPAIGRLISVQQPKAWQIPALLADYCRNRHNKSLAPQAARLLVEITGDELAQLYNEVDKLALFADKEKTITVAHIESLVGHNRLFGAFDVIDAITADQTAQALVRLRRMFQQDKTSQFTIVGAFAWHFRRMFTAKVLLEKGHSAAEVAKSCQIWHKSDAFFAQIRRFSLPRIAKILQQIAEIDFLVKTGRSWPDIAIEHLILTLHSS